ncbi:3',5'-cyclic-nucleotide phosphodiesterase [Komagataeibacter rhaeticus]|nr:3',5'-cyclic-nucleotide phosphodiesterase [Komagataeibacter rhaeticus]
MAGRPVGLAGTGMRVTAFPLSHGSVESTAFLLRSGGDAMLYLGDTGADAVEHSTRLRALWQAVAPLIRAHRLRGIVIECSYDDTHPDTQLWGHLSPRWLLRELAALQDIAHTPLRGMPVLVAHMKPSLRRGRSGCGHPRGTAQWQRHGRGLYRARTGHAATVGPVGAGPDSPVPCPGTMA